MAIVQSSGALKTFAGVEGVPSQGPMFTPSHGALDQATPETYAAIYRTQPHVRTVVDFLARNVAHIPLHAYRRVSDLDRERLANYELLQWLAAPTPATCNYRLIETLVQDLGIYYRAYWLKMRKPNGAIGLMRLSPATVQPVGWLLPSGYIWTLPDGTPVPLAPADLVEFHGYDPDDPLWAVSPIETLRQILAEDCAANAYRRAYWTNSARLEGVITRPKDAPRWTPEQKQAFREQWQSRFSGNTNAGQTAVLEDGMDFKPTSYSARDSELNAARKLTREEVCNAYHVPPPMVGILDHATFSNIKEQHKQLYQDTLGPWLEWIQQELARQLLPDCRDTENVYLEFNIAEKLKGAFEEQATSIFMLTGRPVMTANEGRARLNLPRITDDPSADSLALPLNTSGGPGAVPLADPAPAAAPPPPPRIVDDEAIAAVVRRTWMRQRARLEKLPTEERAAAFQSLRWDDELTDNLDPLYRAVGHTEAAARSQAAAVARRVNTETLRRLVAGIEAFAVTREAVSHVQ